MNGVTTRKMEMMQSTGFGDSVEERIFFTGVPSSRDPEKTARITARKAAAGLMRAFVARGPEDEAHCERVALWSRRLAKEYSLSSERVLDVELGALMHDIGYIGIKGIDFGKNASLTNGEWYELRRHCDLGVAFLNEIPALRRAIPLVAAHHERFDGTGYPHGKRGAAIAIDARLFHLVDAYEALTSDRPYRAKVSDAMARKQIARCVGTQFDPNVYAAFCAIDPAEWASIVERV